MLKRTLFALVGILFVVSSISAQDLAVKTITKSNFEKLAGIDNVVKIEKRTPLDHFDENYEIWFEQPVDHNDLSKGTFRQKVFLGLRITLLRLSSSSRVTGSIQRMPVSWLHTTRPTSLL